MRFGPAIASLLQVPFAVKNEFHPGSDRRDFFARFGSQEGAAAFDAGLDNLIKTTLAHYSVPGLAVAILHGNDTFARGYGTAQFPDVPVTPETIFYGASTTKAFVAAGLSFLVDDDDSYPHVQWTTPISELIPDDFVLEDDYSTLHVTLEDAATHRTGLPRHDFSYLGGNQTAQGVVRSMRYLPLTQPIRTTFQYCNLMYITLGYVIEALTGRWLGDFLKEHIWTPLNMTSSYFSLSDALDSGNPIARGYYWLNESQTFIEVEYVDERATEGAGAVLSNVLDYSKWIRMMMNRDAPISGAGHEALVTPHIILGKRQESGHLVMYGYGWEVEQYRGYEVIYHSGGESGFGSNVLYIPEKKWGCIMMSNSEFFSNIIQEILTWHLVDELLEVPVSERINRTALYDEALAQLLQYRNTTLVRELVYPPESTGNVSTSLPLENYAGTYYHPGYGPWYISYENGTLWDYMRRGSILHYDARLEHISGDYFLAVGYDRDAPDDPFYWEVEFKVGVNGRVEMLGLGLETAMEEKVWFDRRD